MASVVINTRFNNRKAEADLKELQAKANAENHLQIICIRSVVQAVADAVLAVCKERKLTDAKLYTSHWA